MNNDTVLVYKLNIIFLKMQSDLQKMDTDKDFIKVCHQSNLLSWLMLNQILPKLDKEFSLLLKGIFQLMTRIGKYGVERFQKTNNQLIENMFQQKVCRQRSVDFSDCDLCGRKLKVGKVQQVVGRRDIQIEKINVSRKEIVKELVPATVLQVKAPIDSPYRIKSSSLQQPAIQVPHTDVESKIAPLSSSVEQSLADVKMLLGLYQSGEKSLNMNDRQKFKALLGDLEDKRASIEEVQDQLTKVLNIEQSKKKQRLSFVKMLLDDGKQLIDEGVQTDLSLNIFSQIKDQIILLDEVISQKDIEINRLTMMGANQQRALESLALAPPVPPVDVSLTLITPNTNPVSIAQKQTINQKQQIRSRNSLINLNVNNSDTLYPSNNNNFFPTDAIQEIRDHLKTYLTLRFKAKEAVAVFEKLYIDCPVYMQSIKSLNPKIFSGESIKARALKIVETIYNLMKSNSSVKNTILDITNLPIQEYQSKYLKQNLPSLPLVMKQILLQEQVTQAKIQRIPFYDPLYDPEFLEGCKLFLKVNMVDGEDIVEEVIVDNVSKKQIRSRIKPLQKSDLAYSFFNDDEFIIQGIKLKKPVAFESLSTELWTDESGRQIKLLTSTTTEDVFEIIEDNGGENPYRKDRVKQMIVNKTTNQIEEKWEFIDPLGNLHVKKVFVNDEAQIVQEDQIYVRGQINKIIKTKMYQINGADVVAEEVIDEGAGIIVTKTMKKIKFAQDQIEIKSKDKKGILKGGITKQIVQDKDHKLFILQSETDETGKQSSRLILKYKGENEESITEEQITSPEGVKSNIKTIKRKDFNGKDQIEIITNDVNGDETALNKREYENEQGKLVNYQELINMRTQQQDIIVSFVNENGQKVEELSVLDKDGNLIETKNVLYVNDREISEKRIDINKNTFHTTTKNLEKKKQVEEIKVDDNGNETRTTKQFYRKDNADVEEVVQIMSNGQQTKNIVTTVINDDGTKLVEEQREDQFGQKTLLKKRINQNGEQIVEEFEVHYENKVQNLLKIRQYVIRSPHASPLGSPHGEKELENDQFHETGMYTTYCDKQIQTLPQIIPKSQFIKHNNQSMSPNDNLCSNCKKRTESTYSSTSKKPQSFKTDNPNRPIMSYTHQKHSSQQLQTVADIEYQNELEDQMFKKVESSGQNQQNTPQHMKTIKEIRLFFGLSETDPISMDDFKYYLAQLRQSHQESGCGVNCKHLQRFYLSLGVSIIRQVNNREFLKLQYISIHAKPKSNSQLPEAEQYAFHK